MPGGGASGAQTYMVEKGDALSHIAKQFYGQAGKWNAIFAANRDQLDDPDQDDPDKIVPGQVLKIPAPDDSAGRWAATPGRRHPILPRIPRRATMIRNRLQYAVAAALVAMLALAGCKKKEEVAVTPPPAAAEPAPMAPAEMPAAMPVSVIAIDLGNAVGADNKVSATMSTFAAKDTIHAAVTTDGTASGTPLAAKWTFQGDPPMTVNEESKMLDTTGPATTEFHVSRPDGFPVGKYKVEISLNGAVVQSRDFEVK